MTRGAEGDEAGEFGDAVLSVVDDEQLVRAAAPALPGRIEFLGPAGPEQRPLPEQGPGRARRAPPCEGGGSRRLGDGRCAHRSILSLSYDN
jgi:hypothetical protein